MTKKGRPVKDAPVTSGDNLVLPGEEIVAPSLTDTAYGVAKLPGGQFALVRIKYDAVSGSVGTPELTISTENHRADAEEELKIAIAEELLEWG